MSNGECKGASGEGKTRDPGGAREEEAILPEEVFLQRVGEGGEFLREQRERRIAAAFGEVGAQEPQALRFAAEAPVILC